MPLAIATHELRAPLGNLSLQVELLKRSLEGEAPISKLLTGLASAQRQVARLSDLLAHLLDVAHLSTGHLELERQWVDLRELLRQVATQFEEPLARAGCTLTLRAETPLEGTFDKSRLEQVLTNLLTNAQHAMPDGGTITVTLDGTEENVIVTVHDEGTGIPEENLDKLFSPFFTTKQVGKGTGLGLAVTHGIVKMHRGQISVESNADPAKGPTGTTFSISLPRYEAETDVPASLQEITGS
jgi:signal transduction histidine kinase